jgi:hypothetical protein
MTMSNLLRCVCGAVLVLGLSIPASAGDLKLTIANGRVTIIAQDVPLRQILQEWARQGGTTIMNAEKIVGAPITLELVNVSERQALDTLLRSTAGYVAAPRPVGTLGASVYDRIMILPTSRAPATVAAAAPPVYQPRPQPMPVDEEDSDDDQPPNMPFPNPNVGGQPPQVAPQVAPFPGQQPVTQPNGQPMVQPNGEPMMQPNGQPGMQPPPVQTAPRPGALPAPQTPNGMPNPYQPQGQPMTPNGVPNPNAPSVIRPGPGGPGGPGQGPGAEVR